MGTAIRDILDYVKNPEKTDNGKFITSYQCSGKIADAEFLFSKRQYLAKTGRSRGKDDVIAYQVRQSFVPGEITPEDANRLGVEFAKRFTKGNHAFIVCTHIDKEHIHNHIIWNSTTLDCKRKFRDFFRSGRAVRRLSDTICIENGYPSAALADRVYQTRGNKLFCSRHGIRLSGPPLGRRKTSETDAKIKRQMYQDSCERNAIKGRNGNSKRRFGLDRIFPSWMKPLRPKPPSSFWP